MRPRLVWLVVCAMAAIACAGAEPLTETLVEDLEIPSVSLPGRLWDPLFPPIDDGSPTTVGGRLTVPPTSDPVPVVILVHGCGGVGAGERGWTDVLASEGIATLLLDSFSARGVGEVCTGRETLNVASLIVDVYRAAELLEDHPHIDGSKMAVMGFSFGGRTALWSALRRAQDAYGGRPFDGYVAFYPSTCFIRLASELDVVGGPIRIFQGTADDWTPIEPCRGYVERLASIGVDAELVAYEGAPHSFDNQTLAYAELLLSPAAASPRSCSFVEVDGVVIDPETGDVAGVGSPCVESGVTYGYDAEARDRAVTDLGAFFDQIFDSD